MCSSDLPDLTSLPRLADTVRAAGLVPDRRLGQHFLLDPQILAAIVRAAGDLSGRPVLEIGPGPGGLNRAPPSAVTTSVAAPPPSSATRGRSVRSSRCFTQHVVACGWSRRTRSRSNPTG